MSAFPAKTGPGDLVQANRESVLRQQEEEETSGGHRQVVQHTRTAKQAQLAVAVEARCVRGGMVGKERKPKRTRSTLDESARDAVSSNAARRERLWPKLPFVASRLLIRRVQAGGLRIISDEIPEGQKRDSLTATSSAVSVVVVLRYLPQPG